MNRRPLLLALAWMLMLGLTSIAATGTARAQEAAVGYVRVATGDAFILKADNRVAAKVGDTVAQGDVLETGDESTLGVTFRDDSRISLGANSRLSLKAYAFAPAEGHLTFVARIARGTLLYISGFIAKLSPDSVAVETPVATLAVRGTRFLVRVDDEN